MWEHDYHLAARQLPKQQLNCSSVLKFTNQQSAAAQSMLSPGSEHGLSAIDRCD
jgi:hypothetical protein